MFRILSLIGLIYSSLTWASFSLPTVKWEQLTPVQQAAIWVDVRLVLQELNISAPDKIGQSEYSFLLEAYAAGFDCFVAGWPSTMAKGKCQSPAKVNSSYAHHLGCSENQLLCNPTVFGESLCINFKTPAEKNGAFVSCEKKFDQEGRLYSQVLDQVNPEEMNDLLATVHSKCQVNSHNYSCIKLRKQYDILIPNETPASYNAAEKSLSSSVPEKILVEVKKLQREMEQDVSEFEAICADGIEEFESILCKNLALRIKKAHALIPKLHTRINQLTSPDDCINCSSSANNQVLNKDSIPSLEATSELLCTDVERKRNSEKCFGEVQCVIISTAMTVPNAILETFGNKPTACNNSQNSCLTNIISAMIKSFVSLVTGIWDLLGSAVNWAGEKISDFWNYVTEIEDKTADVQHLVNKMSDKDIQEVKTNPIKWITNLASNVWQGLKEWMKEDIFCEKWAGIPRASECVEPSKGLDCMSCRTMISGTCSVGGVILAEFLPALITGGTANVVARVGTGAKDFTTLIKVSKSYKRVVTAVENLSDIKALKILSTTSKAAVKGIKLVVNPVSKVTRITSEALSSSYKTMVSSKSYKALSKSMDVAAKYSGVSAYNKLNVYMYKKGYTFVDSMLGVKASQASGRIIAQVNRANTFAKEISSELKPLVDDIVVAQEKQLVLNKLRAEAEDLNKIEKLSPDEISKVSELSKKILEAESDIIAANNGFIEKLLVKYEEKGIPASIIKNTDGSKTLHLNFDSKPTGNEAFEFYRKVHKNFGLDIVTLSLKDNLSISSLGFFMPSMKRIDMGPGQGFSLLEEYFNTVSKHESRHAMFFAKRSRGEDSVFHARFMASSDGKLLNADKYYDTFMSAEELYTFSTDLQSLAQVFKGEMITDLVKRQSLIESITDKSASLKTVATTSQKVTQSMIESLDELMVGSNKASLLDLEMNKDGSWKLLFKDKLGRQANITLTGAEEKLLAKNLQKSYVAKMDEMEKALKVKLAEAGVDTKVFSEKFVNKTLTTEESALLNKVQTSYFASPEGKSLLKEIDNSCIPIIQNAKKMMTDLNKLSTIQIKESEYLTTLLKRYTSKETGGSVTQLEALKDQMFKTAKNVKEDYKGYVLKSP